jgi:tetratricopeptide (TPR) repeat protein
MAMTVQSNHIRGRFRILLLCAGLSLPAVVAAAEDSSPIVDAAFEKLEALRISHGDHSDAVRKIVTETQKQLDRADERLVREIGNLPSLSPKSKPSVRALQEHNQALRSLRTRRCQLARRKGQLHAKAVSALPAESEIRGEYLHRARQSFGAMRLDYVDLPLSMVGYLEEARLLRQVGRVDAAETLLKPIFALSDLTKTMKRNDPRRDLIAQLIRKGRLESLEWLLPRDPAQAVREAQTYRAELNQNATDQARCDWIQIRARLASSSKKSPPNAPMLAKMLREDSLAKVVCAYDRLEVLDALDTSCGGVMTKSERLAWADLRAQGRWPDALEQYGRAWAMQGPAFSNEQLARYLQLLQSRSGPYASVTAVCDEWLGRMDPADKKQAPLLALRSAAWVHRLQAAGKDSPDYDALRAKTLAALRETFSFEELDAASRIDALRQWVVIQNTADMHSADILETLSKDDLVKLVDKDAFLLYARAVARWRGLVAGPAEDRGTRVKAVQDDLKRAGESADRSLQASSALLRAQIAAAGTRQDHAEALEILTSAWPVLKEQKNLLVPALKLRLDVLVNLGQTDAAGNVLDELAQHDTLGAAETILLLAEALAKRYQDVADKTDLQTRVIALCERAQRAARREKTNADSLLQRTAEVLLSVRAYTDAERLLTHLLNDPKRDPKNDLPRRLLLAEANIGAGRKSEGLAELKRLAEQSRDSARVQLALGKCQLQLRNPVAAATAYRAARKHSKPGGAVWCRASLGLARALQRQNHLQAAEDVLRIAAVLYPEFGTPELRAEQVQLRETLQTPAAKNPVDVDSTP